MGLMIFMAHMRNPKARNIGCSSLPATENKGDRTTPVHAKAAQGIAMVACSRDQNPSVPLAEPFSRGITFLGGC